MNESGICGWLSRDGEFYKCNETKHNLLAVRLEKELGLEMFDLNSSKYLHDTALLEALGFVKFTQCTYKTINESYSNRFILFLGERFSYKQRKWMEQNIIKMSPRQKSECRERLTLGH